jgi:hypothetical protein
MIGCRHSAHLKLSTTEDAEDTEEKPYASCGFEPP